MPFVLLGEVTFGVCALRQYQGKLSPAPPRADYRLRTPGLIKFLHGGGLGLANAPGFDPGTEVVFAANGSA